MTDREIIQEMLERADLDYFVDTNKSIEVDDGSAGLYVRFDFNEDDELLSVKALE